MTQKKILKSELIEEAWNRGLLSYKLRKEQRKIYKSLRDARGLKYALYCSRRWGKSFISRVMAIEDCLRHKKWEIGFVAPTQIALARIYKPMDSIIFSDCPAELKPRWDREMSAYEFSNGSWLFQSGTDNRRYEGMRGMNLHKCYYDEPGSMSDLKLIVGSIVQPMTLTTRIERGDECAQIFLGTPASTPGHDYFFIKEECKSIGNYSKMTIDDNSSLDESTKKLYLEECLTEDEADREYYCKDVTNTEYAIIPEMTEDKEIECVSENPRPRYFNAYGSCDPAFNDFTAYLLGYYDFAKASYIIESELLINKSNSQQVALAIKEAEKNTFGTKDMYLRVCDTDPQFICDMSELHDIQFVATAKDNKEQQINYLRSMLYKNRLIINPNCKALIRQMRTGLWNKGRTSFVRNDIDGHYDLIDAAIYLLRNIDTSMPYPSTSSMFNEDTHFVRPSENIGAFAEIYGEQNG